jgi:mRNA interferase RelE/StbE
MSSYGNRRRTLWQHKPKGRFQKDLDGIPKKDLRKILSRIKFVAADPRPDRCEKLTGQYRYRLKQGRYRIV